MALLTDFLPIQKTLEHAPVHVSFAVAAQNSEDLLSDTLESLLAQSHPFWEAVIVTGGKSDPATLVASRYAAQDNRFRLLSLAKGGSSDARNMAVGESQYDWIACIDAGDMLEPDYLETMASTLAEDTALDAVCCEHARYYTLDGSKVAQPLLFEPEDFFLTSAQSQPISSNAIVARKSLIVENGLFDPKLQVYGDWDLWQRIARAGAKIELIHEPLALQRMKLAIAAATGFTMLAEAVRIISTGHATDARVPYPASEFAAGAATRGVGTQKLQMACWAAGYILGSGESAVGVFSMLEGVKSSDLEPESIANAIYDSALLPTASEPEAWHELMPRISDNVNLFLNALETHSGCTGVANSSRIFLDRKIADEAITSYRVSFVIAAYNASSTIAETLDSLLAQTKGNWEAVIVNDGSKDNTPEIVQEYVERDGRFRIVNQENGGVSKARNTGVLATKNYWIAFLDSDDMIEPNYLELMTGALATDNSLDVAYCEYCRLTPDGIKVPKLNWFDPEDLFDVSTNTCPVAAHGTVVRKSIILDVGLFDTSLKTCEDWDLWQRIARSGAKFGAVKEPLAIYRMRPGSASNHGRQMLKDSLVVIERGHTPDPRVRMPDRRYALGANPRLIPDKVLESSAWAAGLILGSGGDARVLLELMATIHSPNISPLMTAEAMFEAALLPRALKPADGQMLFAEMRENFDAYMDALEKHNGAPKLAIRTRRALELIVLQNSPNVEPTISCDSYMAKIDITRPILDIDVPKTVERANLAIFIGNEAIGTISLPIIDGKLSAYVLMDSIAGELGRIIVANLFRKTIFDLLSLVDVDVHTGQIKIFRGDTLLSDAGYRQPNDPAYSKFWDKAGNYVYWTIFLQEVWDRPTWSFDQFYSLRTPDSPAGIVSAKDSISIDVFDEMPNILVLSSHLDLTITVAGTHLCTFSIPSEGRLITSQEVRAWISTSCATELCAAVVRECVLGRQLDGNRTIRELGKEALAARNRRKTSDAKLSSVAPQFESEIVRACKADPEAAVIARRATPVVQGGASRRAMLPASALADVEKIVGPAAYKPADVKSVLYVPDATYSAETLAQLAKNSPGHAHASPFLMDALTPGRGILPRKPQPLARVGRVVNRFLGRGGRGAKSVTGHQNVGAALSGQNSMRELPILMYHRIAPFGAYKSAQWRTDPEKFDAQMRYLVENGFRSMTLEEWYNYKTVRKQMPQRAVLLTFDDGFDDFAVYAWPILKKYGLGAINYLVTSLIGRSNEWDSGNGESVPLMNWDTIKRLRDEGAEFGSHTCTHSHLTGLSVDDVTYELAHSRAVLQKELGLPISSIAYPFGDCDSIVAHIAGACGYDFAVTCEGGFATYESKLLLLPREEMADSTTLSELADKLLIS